jgi:hypothetical protein
MVAGKLFVRAMNPGTGTVSILLVGRLTLRELSFARATANTTYELAMAAQRIAISFFTVTKDYQKQAAFKPQTRWITFDWPVLNGFDPSKGAAPELCRLLGSRDLSSHNFHAAKLICVVKGVSATPLSTCYLSKPRKAGLILGYGGTDVHQIQDGVRKLKLSMPTRSSNQQDKQPKLA